MDPQTMIEGSIEIRTTENMSIGVPGKRWTLDVVPVVLETLQGVTGLVSVTPQAQPTGRTPEAQWTGVDANNQSVEVYLWRDIPYEETAVAQAIAQAIAEGQGT